MKSLFSILTTLAIAALFLCMTGCAANGAQPTTPTGIFLQQAEKITVAIASDQVRNAVLKDTSLSPAEQAAALNALVDLPEVISSPHASSVVQTAWDAAKPFLQQYSTSAKGAIIGPATYKLIEQTVMTYIASLKAQEAAKVQPATQPTGAATQPPGRFTAPPMVPTAPSTPAAWFGELPRA